MGSTYYSSEEGTLLFTLVYFLILDIMNWDSPLFLLVNLNTIFSEAKSVMVQRILTSDKTFFFISVKLKGVEALRSRSITKDWGRES